MPHISDVFYIAEEIRELLEVEDIELLSGDLRGMAWSEWLAWEESHRDQAISFVQATPSQRDKRKKWQEPVLRRRLVLSAYQLARLGADLFLATGGLPREKTARAASSSGGWAYLHMASRQRWVWPFYDHEMPEGFELPSNY